MKGLGFDPPYLHHLLKSWSRRRTSTEGITMPLLGQFHGSQMNEMRIRGFFFDKTLPQRESISRPSDLQPVTKPVELVGKTVFSACWMHHIPLPHGNAGTAAPLKSAMQHEGPSAGAIGRDRIVVSTSRCGRDNPGSNPGHGRVACLSVMAYQRNF